MENMAKGECYDGAIVFCKAMTSKEKQAKVRFVMNEFKSGKLKSSSGDKITDPRQALAIALSEAGLSRKPKKDMGDEYYMAFMKELGGEEDRDDAESFSPPSSVRAAARRGLELRKKHGKGGLTTQEAGKQGIGSGVARATSLANGDKVSYETIKRMAAFFSRHAKNKSGGEDDAGFISHNLWGGDAGERWARSIIERVEKEKKDGL
jgi:hypothetical protein